jgi:acetylglutamate kinase
MRRHGSRNVEISALRHAVPYLALFRGLTFVVKLGGGALGDRRTLDGVVEQLAALHHLGIRVVVVHGGGPQANELSRALGVEVRQVGGRRITDDATLPIVTMVLNGATNTEIVASCRRAQLPAVGLSGVDGNLIVARRRPPVAVEGESAPVDFGHVGDVVALDTTLVEKLLDGGFVPVVSPLSADRDGDLLNLNADGVAGAFAAALRAEKLLVLVDPPGLLADPEDPASLVSYVDLAGIERMRRDGAIARGMLPKVAAIAAALGAGVPRAHLVSWRSPDALLLEVFSNEGAGTLVVPELAALLPDEREERPLEPAAERAE